MVWVEFDKYSYIWTKKSLKTMRGYKMVYCLSQKGMDQRQEIPTFWNPS